MSLSGAFNNALSGLQAARRASQVVSNNVANALTPGYSVRRLELSSSALFGGVSAAGITRTVDQQLVADHRIAIADNGFATDTAKFQLDLEKLIGTPDKAGSLNARLSEFEGALISAASRPDAQERLDAILKAAQDLAASISSTSNGIQEARTNADAAIDAQVKSLNDSLAEIQKLNTSIVKANAVGQEKSALLDQRQALIDTVSKIVPVRTAQRENGAVAVFSTGGAILLEGKATTIEFSGTSGVTPYMTYDNAQLSGLVLNGVEVDMSSSRGLLRGGTLGAQFEIRDQLAVEAQSQLDAMARDLVERFADPSVDPTLGVNDAGLFTDAGIAFDPANEVGLSERLSVNVLVDPDQGGELWRLRAGLGAAVHGNTGDATILQNLSDALSAQRTLGSGNFGTGSFSALDVASTFQSQVSSASIAAERGQTFSSSRMNELKQLILEKGVDNDAELQRLLLIEKVYAANARVIEVADDMLEQLLRL